MASLVFNTMDTHMLRVVGSIPIHLRHITNLAKIGRHSAGHCRAGIAKMNHTIGRQT